MRRVQLCLMLFLALALPARATGNTPDDVAAFEAANLLYEEGRYNEAIEAYQRSASNAPSVAVFFNLGNAYFKAGRVGDAIVEYRRAQQLAPRDPDVRANLQFSRARVSGPTHSPGWLEQRTQSLTPGEWRLVGSVAIWLFAGLLMTRELAARWRASLRAWILPGGILTALILAGVVWINQDTTRQRSAVVTQPSVVMRLGPFEESESMVELNNGAELQVLDVKKDWLQVTADEQQVGWVPATAVRIIQPRPTDASSRPADHAST